MKLGIALELDDAYVPGESDACSTGEHTSTQLRSRVDAEPASDVKHLAIIMDGNGRWAQSRGLSRNEGHRQGVEALRKTVRWVAARGIKYLTVFSFSSENWSRPRLEVAALLRLMKAFVRDDLEQLAREGVCVKILGRRDGLTRDLIETIELVERRTSVNSTFYLNIAFNYGARDEITRAARAMAEDVRDGSLDLDAVDEEVFSKYLDTKATPDLDLLIRTSGEVRLSNFLLWQSAYTEFVFVPTFWPDFSDTILDMALDEFSRRKRRFGGLEVREEENRALMKA